MEAKVLIMPGHYSPEEFTRLNKQAEMKIEERKRLIGQARKEWFAELEKYRKGYMADGKGMVFVVPLEKVKEWGCKWCG